MALNWATVFNRLFEIINEPGDCYFSGGRFISKVREVDPYFPDYGQYMDERKRSGKNTGRKSYYYDILVGLDELSRVRLVSSILSDVERCGADATKVQELRAILGGAALAPAAVIPAEAWNAERLNEYLEEIDTSIAAGHYDRAVTLAYTCLEGFYKAFGRQNLSPKTTSGELLALSKDIKQHLKATLKSYPDEALNLITTISHAVDRARNRFSEAHFEGEAGRWLAMYIRDLVNTQIRLLLHFM